MKKFVVILFMLLFVFSTTACAAGSLAPKTALAYDIYSKAAEAMEDVESLAADTVMTMTTTVDGEEFEIEMSGFIKAVTLSETEVEMHLNMSTTIMGEKMNIEAFFKDGVYYMEMQGQKISMEMPLEQVMQQAHTKLLDFPDTAIKNQQETKKDGGEELSFVLDGAVLTDAIAEQMGGLADMLGEQADMTIGDIEYVVFIDGKGNLKTTTMNFSMEMGVMGETVPVSMEMSMEYVQINNVTIDFPNDLDSYMLMGNMFS